MKLHHDFISGSFELNTASILTALLPVVASRVADADDMAATVRQYLEGYGAYLASISERDLTVALSKAAKMIRASGDGAP